MVDTSKHVAFVPFQTWRMSTLEKNVCFFAFFIGCKRSAKHAVLCKYILFCIINIVGLRHWSLAWHQAWNMSMWGFHYIFFFLKYKSNSKLKTWNHTDIMLTWLFPRRYLREVLGIFHIMLLYTFIITPRVNATYWFSKKKKTLQDRNFRTTENRLHLFLLSWAKQAPAHKN